MPVFRNTSFYPHRFDPKWVAALFAIVGVGLELYVLLKDPSGGVVAVAVPIAATFTLLAIRGFSGRPFARINLGWGRIIAIILVLVGGYFLQKAHLPLLVMLFILGLILTYAWLQDKGRVP